MAKKAQKRRGRTTNAELAARKLAQPYAAPATRRGRKPRSNQETSTLGLTLRNGRSGFQLAVSRTVEGRPAAAQRIVLQDAHEARNLRDFLNNSDLLD